MKPLTQSWAVVGYNSCQTGVQILPKSEKWSFWRIEAVFETGLKG